MQRVNNKRYRILKVKNFANIIRYYSYHGMKTAYHLILHNQKLLYYHGIKNIHGITFGKYLDHGMYLIITKINHTINYINEICGEYLKIW